MRDVFVGIGSNLGDRVSFCTKAVAALEDSGVCTVVRRSSLYETEPWGGVTEQPFVNMVVEIETGAKPGQLLSLLKNIERLIGREERERWGAREVDLDILLFGTDVVAEPGLSIPHERLCERRFVLVPLAEIRPTLPHPVSGETVQELLERCPDRGWVRPYEATATS